MHCNLNLPLLVALAMTSITGCAVMPYKDTFDCPQQANGRCVSVSQAHELAVKGDPSATGTLQKAGDSPKQESPAPAQASTEADREQSALRLELLTEYVKGNKAPAVPTSPVIMETVILPYQTWFGTLAGERTLWVPVEDAKWVWPDQFDAKAHSEIGSITK